MMEIAVWKTVKASITSLASSLTPFKLIEWQNGASFQTARFYILVLNRPKRTKKMKAEQEYGSAPLSLYRLQFYTVSMSNQTIYLEGTNGTKRSKRSGWLHRDRAVKRTGSNGAKWLLRTGVYWSQWNGKTAVVKVGRRGPSH